MKRNLILNFCTMALLAGIPSGAFADIFFNDNFTNGSTINSSTPANPTTNSTAYQQISAKTWVPNPPTVTSRDLKFGIGASGSGSTEIQALFATNAVALTANGDYIQLTVTFTNTSGLLTQASALGFGLYNSGQLKPVTNGLNGTATTSSSTAATGAAQNWLGYVGQLTHSAYANNGHRIMTRAAQTGTFNNNQDVVTSSSGSSSYANPVAAIICAASPSTLTLVAGATYTEVLTITLLTNDFNSLTITNILYAGPNTSGSVITNFGGIATNATLLTSGFDAFGIGWRATITVETWNI